MQKWRLRSRQDYRFRMGHPWVFANELDPLPQAQADAFCAGEAVELRDPQGKFLAYGMGNLHSLIQFRAVSRNPNETDALGRDGLLRRLRAAQRVRLDLGFGDLSYRLCYGEGDNLPGLIVDRYCLNQGQAYVVQAHTAGAQRWIAEFPSILESVSADAASWAQTSVILRNDLQVRLLENLPEQEAQVCRQGDHGPAFRWEDAEIHLAATEGSVRLRANLFQGQKTGFFLDQRANVARSLGLFRPVEGAQPGALRILDLCSYVGQWSTQWASHLRRLQPNRALEVTLVDASAEALRLALANVRQTGAQAVAEKLNVLTDLSEWNADSYDWVVADPPSFIHAKSGIRAGQRAYLTLATQALRLTRPGGYIVFCSCSRWLTRNDLGDILARASLRSAKPVRWWSQGEQSPDHPLRAGFPEGHYLQAWVGQVEGALP